MFTGFFLLVPLFVCLFVQFPINIISLFIFTQIGRNYTKAGLITVHLKQVRHDWTVFKTGFTADSKKLFQKKFKNKYSVQGERRVKSAGRALSRRQLAAQRDLLQEQPTPAQCAAGQGPAGQGAAGQGAAGRQHQRHQAAAHVKLPLPAADRHFLQALCPSTDCV